MKKALLAILATVAMVACSNDEVVRQAAPEAISFENVFVDNATRSVNDPSLDATTLQKYGFGVYGFVKADRTAPIFDNEEVTYDQTNGWSYTNKQYWIPGATYDFFAVAPFNAYSNVVATPATPGTPGTGGLSLSFTNVDGTTDLLYAQNKDMSSTGATPVGFTFRHTLSKVKFSFENNNQSANTTIKVYEVKINNPYKTGTVTLGDTTLWSDQALDTSATGFVLDFGAATDKEGTDAKENVVEAKTVGTYESQNELLLIPANYPADNKLSVSFKYDVVVGTTVVKTFEVNPDIAVNLEPGKAYDFKATITPGEEIKFTVTAVDGWDTDLNDDGTDEDETPIP